jgi:hypothetical protein
MHHTLIRRRFCTRLLRAMQKVCQRFPTLSKVRLKVSR